jgi:hypothetical protein
MFHVLTNSVNRYQVASTYRFFKPVAMITVSERYVAFRETFDELNNSSF